MKQLQFELWKECNNRCTFCYLGDTNLHTSDEVKLNNLEKALEIIRNKDLYKEYDTVGFIGGEFFQGQLNTATIKNKFFELVTEVKSLIKEGLIRNLWICATLTIGDQRDLYEVLEILKDIQEHVWILTSYDTLGRFHTNGMEESWKANMLNIKNEYPFLNLNTTTIITGDLIEKYLSGQFSFKELKERYQTALFIKLCAYADGKYMNKDVANKALGNFFPKRNNFLAFLRKIKISDPDLYDKLFNIEYRADTLLCEYQDSKILISRNKETKMESFDPTIDHILPCGHLSIYNCYLDSDKCALCDKALIDKLV